MKPNLTTLERTSSSLLKWMKNLIGAPLVLGAVLLAAGCDRSPPASNAKFVDDDDTSSRVQSALKADTAYKFPDVKVVTFQGKVQLSGFVDDRAQKDRATAIAKNTVGVRDVENSISLK